VLASDVIVIADSDNWSTEVPSLTVSLRASPTASWRSQRSITACTPESGAASRLTSERVGRLLASLHDDDGNVAVAGLHEETAADVDYSPERCVRRPAYSTVYPKSLGLCAATTLGEAGDHGHRHRRHVDRQVVEYADPAGAGQGQHARRAGRRPERTFGGADPSSQAARAMGSARHRATRRHGAAVRDRRERAGLRRRPRRVLATAWGHEPVDTGVGGSIPFIAEFAAAFPSAKILVTGVEDPQTQAHSINESLHLGVLERAATAEALLLANLGQTDRSRRSLATCPVARTLYWASAILPFSSTTNVERITPRTVLPYIVFSP